MQDLITFFKDILMMNSKNECKIGLSQFKEETSKFTPKKVVSSHQEVKLSDLMRRSA